MPTGNRLKWTAPLPSKRVAVYNVGGEFYATDNICTHAQALLSEGWLEAMSLNVLFTVAL